MNYDDLNPELKQRALACKTTEELIALAESEGVELTDSQIEGFSGGDDGASPATTTSLDAPHTSSTCRLEYMSKDVSPDRTLGRKGVRVLLLSILTLMGVAIVQIAGYVVTALLFESPEDLTSLTICEGIGAAGAMLGMVVLGGATWLKASREDFCHMLHVGWPVIVVDILALIFAIVSYMLDGGAIAPDWLPNLGLTLLLCLGIGIFEECMFRGIILNGLLAPLGKNHRGTLVAMALTSLLFGLVHVDVSTDFANEFLAAQAALKVIQTGLFSVILCGVVLHTHHMGGVSVFHGFTNFLLMVPSLVLAGDSLTIDYATSGEDGVAFIVVYLVSIAVYLPLAIKTLRILRRDQVAYRGAFMQKSGEAASTTRIE